MFRLHPARMNDSHLARLFLIGLTAVGLFVTLLGVSPAELSFIPCLFHVITDIPCPGCGMTRACLSLTQGEFVDAWRYHPFSFFLVGLALVQAFFPTWLRLTWHQCSRLIRNVVLIGGLLITLAVWLDKVWKAL